MAPDAGEQTSADAPSSERRLLSTRSTKPIRIPLAPIALLVGVALIGNGVDGSLGAGVALVASVAVGILGALVSVSGEGRRIDSQRTKKTLRHRWFQAVDHRERRREAKKRERARRKDAERAFLHRRRERRDRAKGRL